MSNNIEPYVVNIFLRVLYYLIVAKTVKNFTIIREAGIFYTVPFNKQKVTYTIWFLLTKKL